MMCVVVVVSVTLFSFNWIPSLTINDASWFSLALSSCIGGTHSLHTYKKKIDFRWLIVGTWLFIWLLSPVALQSVVTTGTTIIVRDYSYILYSNVDCGPSVLSCILVLWDLNQLPEAIWTRLIGNSIDFCLQTATLQMSVLYASDDYILCTSSEPFAANISVGSSIDETASIVISGFPWRGNTLTYPTPTTQV